MFRESFCDDPHRFDFYENGFVPELPALSGEELQSIEDAYEKALDLLEGPHPASWDEFLEAFCDLGVFLGFKPCFSKCRLPQDFS